MFSRLVIFIILAIFQFRSTEILGNSVIYYQLPHSMFLCLNLVYICRTFTVEFEKNHGKVFLEVHLLNLTYLHSLCIINIESVYTVMKLNLFFIRKKTGVSDDFLQSANSWVNIRFMSCISRPNIFNYPETLFQR